MNILKARAAHEGCNKVHYTIFAYRNWQGGLILVLHFIDDVTSKFQFVYIIVFLIPLKSVKFLKKNSPCGKTLDQNGITSRREHSTIVFIKINSENQSISKFLVHPHDSQHFSLHPSLRQ